MKHEKRLIVITTVLTLLPVLIGLILWNKLPASLPVHWNAAGEVDSYASKPAAVFGMGIFLAAVHLFAVFVTGSDPKNVNVAKKVNQLVLWICPCVALFVTVMIYSASMNVPLDAKLLPSLFMGLIFIIIGNYLPKCRQNYTIGIKLPWTLADETNWNKTHRMAGPLWMAAGFVMILAGFFGSLSVYLLLPVITLAVLIPTVYSYLLYRRGM